MKIVLVGYRATGKTSVGRHLARILGFQFVDLDAYLEAKVGKSIAEIVAEGGWKTFRQLEKEILKEMCKKENVVLALGGGAVMHEAEMETLARDSLVVWLTASPRTIAQRLHSDPKTASQRPSLTGQDPVKEIEEVLTRRLPLYRRFAHLVCNTEKANPEEVAREIVSRMGREADNHLPS